MEKFIDEPRSDTEPAGKIMASGTKNRLAESKLFCGKINRSLLRFPVADRLCHMNEARENTVIGAFHPGDGIV
ncbi:MAG: hypothetical protein RR177_04885, partial [Oscillospiraceae bacterium]